MVMLGQIVDMPVRIEPLGRKPARMRRGSDGNGIYHYRMRLLGEYAALKWRG